MEMTQYLHQDLSRLEDLSLQTIQKCLKARYERDLIYTNISDILIAINPRKRLNIYDEVTHREYDLGTVRLDAQPHIFNVAVHAFKRMRETDTNQVIIVSGESGSGKTESTKYIVKHVVHMCQKGDMQLHDKIVKISPLLEAFGNAKTVMNDNSSRYAKYLELSFKPDGELAGAVVRDYMLEKSRVVHQSPGESIFHIFYALFAGCPPQAKEGLFLVEPPENYRIMQSDPQSLYDTERYKQMYFESMDILQKLKVDREILQAMLAAVILIAQIDFEEDNRGAAQISDTVSFRHAAILLGLDETLFGGALIASTRRVAGNETVATHKTLKQAKDGRDALAKMLYERMFGWLVRMINQDLHPNRLGTNIAASIGILDIAGFEKLQNNSFEQLCINLVNEKLQNFMNKKIFTMEIEIYKEEGILIEGISFTNNDDLLQMFEKPNVGVLDILNENSQIEHGSDEGFVKHLKQKHGQNRHFQMPPGDRPVFCIQHFAALVPYNAEGIVEKNRDRLNAELVQVMRQSKDDFIADLFTIKRGPTGTISMDPTFHFRASKRWVHVMPSGKPKPFKQTPQGEALAKELGKSLKERFGTVHNPSEMTQITPRKDHQTLVSFFRQSLLDLLGKLGDAEPFFVRCIKANTSMSHDCFDDVVVGDQLRYNGLAEIAKIRQMGYDVRKTYIEFFERYRALFPRLPPSEHSDVTMALLAGIRQDFHKEFRCGKSRVFMTSHLKDWLERVLVARQNSAARQIVNCLKKVAEIKKQKKTTSLSEDSATDGSRTPGTSTRSSLSGDDEPPSGDPITVPKVPVEPPPSPVISIDDRDGAEDKDAASERMKTETAFWDVCQIISRERKHRDVDEDRGLQVIKVVAYVLLFCILLWCAVAQKVSFMTLVSYRYNTSAGTPTEAKDVAARHILLTIAILVPYCLIFLSSLFKWIFGNFPVPSLSTFIVGVVVESLHAFGLCILTFLVLPQVGIVRGIFLLNGVAIIPSILFQLCASDVKIKQRHTESKGRQTAVFSLNMLTIIIQFGYIPFIILTDFPVKEYELRDIVLFVIAIFFISIYWWENFTDDRFCGPTNERGCWKNFILKTKFDLQEARPVITTCTSVIKIGLIFLITWLLKAYVPNNIMPGEKENKTRAIADIKFVDAFRNINSLDLSEKSSILTLTLTAFVGYYVGYTACKLKLQRFSFNIPLLLSTPLAVLVTALDCKFNTVLNPFITEVRECYDEKDNIRLEVKHWVFYVVGFTVWFSLYWLCRHVFYPNVERLAKTERLFINPYYCGIFFEQSMLLNRRRHTRKIYKELRNDKVSYRLSAYNSKVNIEGEEEAEDDGKMKDPFNKPEWEEEEADVKDEQYINPKFRDIPMIYACATMWHETKYEMIQLMKSIFKMDRDQCVRRHAEAVFQKEDKDFYEFEAHILFDDAMTLNDDEEWVPNDFVKLLMTIMDEAASGVYQKHMKIKPPFRIPTPYGGQLIFTMPGENFLFIHLKDKNKIRHRKRWSQVMYMYYLLGFRIVRMCEETVTKAMDEGKINDLLGWEESEMIGGGFGRSHIFRAFDEQVLKRASNTFLLALDGDVDFSPGAVRLLLDRMRKSEKVGAACGRIHPIGTGPVVWFQKFEYAIAHWLQKATEHVLGCVLCSPGCFSMFRGSALMDDNVMKKYTILPTEATHHLIYDQGEDRWLCTLLLQQGYRVDYAAGSDAFTYAPEGFAEFFNQRRRWMPSTVFNIIDLLADYKNTVYINSNISMLYMIYQGALLLSTIIGPATVLMMIATANVVVFRVSIIWGYVIALAPAVIYFLVCLYCKPKVQIQVAEIFTGLFAFVMMIVLVGTIVTAVKESPLHPSVIFLGVLVITFLISAFLHPKEWFNIIFGLLYFILIPTGFLLLNIYSLCNLHVVSWGTREVPKKKTKEEIEKEKREAEDKSRKKKEGGFFYKMFPSAPMKEFKELLSKITEVQAAKPAADTNATTKLLTEINDTLKHIAEKLDGSEQKQRRQEQEKPVASEDSEQKTTQMVLAEVKPKSILKTAHPTHETERSVSVAISESVRNIDDGTEETIYDKVKPKRDELVNPAWLECKELGNGKVIPLAEEEMEFWKGFIYKYLQPLTLTDQEKKDNAKSLIELRNNIAVGMAVINLMWIAINFMFQLTSPTAVKLPLPGYKINTPASPDDLEENQRSSSNTTADNIQNVDILGLLFIFFYLAILVLQFIGMVIHRWGTFLHLVSVTKLRNPLPFKLMENKQKRNEQEMLDDIKAEDGRKIIDAILSEPLPDYSDDSDDENFEEEKQQEIEALQRTGSRFRMTVTPSGIRATSRQLGESWAMRDDLRQTRTVLSKSAKAIHDVLRATLARNTLAPEGDNIRHEMQSNYFKKIDRNVDRPLPQPPLGKQRLYLGPGRARLLQRLQNRRYFRHSSPNAPLIEEDDQADHLFEHIGSKGTVGREIGMKLRLYAKSQTAVANGTPRVTFADSGRPVSIACSLE